MVSVRAAMAKASKQPIGLPDNLLIAPVHELVCRSLFMIANDPNPRRKGAMRRASTAQKMVLDRLVGRRRAGTSPVRKSRETLQFVDLTKGALSDD